MQDKRIQRTLFGATFTPIDRQCQLKIIESSDYYSLAHPPTQATAFPLNSPFDIIMFIFRLLNSSSVSQSHSRPQPGGKSSDLKDMCQQYPKDTRLSSAHGCVWGTQKIQFPSEPI